MPRRTRSRLIASQFKGMRGMHSFRRCTSPKQCPIHHAEYEEANR